ncbi:MAG: DUF2304 family protein [bacterium]
MVIQFLLVAIFALILIVTWRRFQEKNLSLPEALVWSLVWVGGILVAIDPELTNRLAQILGVGRGADAIVYLSLVVIFWLLFRIFVKIEKLERHLTELVQHEALEDFDRELQEKL